MEHEIYQILKKHNLTLKKREEVLSDLLILFNKKKIFEIDFEGNVLTKIEIENNTPKVIKAESGWGNGIDLKKCFIKEI